MNPLPDSRTRATILLFPVLWLGGLALSGDPAETTRLKKKVEGLLKEAETLRSDDINKARAKALEAETLCDEVPLKGELRLKARVFHMLGALCNNDTKHDRALALLYFNKSLALWIELKDQSPLAAHTRWNLVLVLDAEGDHLASLGKQAEARAHYEKALALLEEARQSLQKALPSARSADKEKYKDRLGKIENRLNTISPKVIGKKAPDKPPPEPMEAKSMGRWIDEGRVHREKGAYAAATECYLQALKMSDALPKTTHLVKGRILANLSFLKGMEALRLAKQFQLPSAYKLGTDAQNLIRDGMRLVRTHVELCAAHQTEREQLEMAADLRKYLDCYLSATVDPLNDPTLRQFVSPPDQEIYEEVLSWKGSVTARQVWVRLRRDVRDPRQRKQLEELQGIVRELSKTAAPLKGEANEVVLRLLKQKEALEQELADAGVTAVGADQTQRPDLARLRAVLPRDAVYLDFLEYAHYLPKDQRKDGSRTERRVLLFVVGHDSVKLLLLGPSAAIRAAMSKWLEGFKNARDEADERAEKALRELIVKPLQGALRDSVKLVLVSPDGPLCGCPWAALLGAPARLQVATVPTPLLLVKRPARVNADAPTNSDCLLFDAPDFGIPRNGDPQPLTALEPDASKSEVATAFQQAFGEKVVELQAQTATAEAFWRAAPGKRVIHLYTHCAYRPQPREEGETDRDFPFPLGNKSGLGPRPSLDRFLPGADAVLYFAGANRIAAAAKPEQLAERGMLSAMEVADLNLSAELVVLKSCEGVLGQESIGEGLLGMQRGFHLAGARTVLGSLWRVDPRVSTVLVQRFLRYHWEERLSKLDALQKAQTDIQEGKAGGQSQGPFYWAGWVLSGAAEDLRSPPARKPDSPVPLVPDIPSPEPNQSNPGENPLTLLGLVVAVLVLGLVLSGVAVWWRRRTIRS